MNDVGNKVVYTEDVVDDYVLSQFSLEKTCNGFFLNLSSNSDGFPVHYYKCLTIEYLFFF